MQYTNKTIDQGACPYAVNVTEKARRNPHFRSALWTGNHLQMTLMNILPCGSIGLEIHEDTDQILRIEQGHAIVKMGEQKDQLTMTQHLHEGETLFVPAGIWHNVWNQGKIPLKISSIYGPPHHPWGVVQETKAEE